MCCAWTDGNSKHFYSRDRTGARWHWWHKIQIFPYPVTSMHRKLAMIWLICFHNNFTLWDKTTFVQKFKISSHVWGYRFSWCWTWRWQPSGIQRLEFSLKQTYISDVSGQLTTLMMTAVQTSETSVYFNKIILCYVSEASHLHVPTCFRYVFKFLHLVPRHSITKIFKKILIAKHVPHHFHISSTWSQ